MQIISSYGVELRKQNIPIRQTLEIYRSAVSYLIGIYVQVWEGLAEIPDAKRRFNAAEHLVHTTKKNHACFDFDIRFPKMPSYLRRSAIQHALGTVSSYKTRLDLWEKTDRKSGKPKLVYENHAMPVFYRDVMYREGAEGKDEAYLKLYDNSHVAAVATFGKKISDVQIYKLQSKGVRTVVIGYDGDAVESVKRTAERLKLYFLRLHHF